MATLVGALDDACSGTCRVVEIRGEPGIGKTRLIAELADRAEERRLLVVGGRGAELEREAPFGLFVDALDDYLASQPRKLFSHLGADLAGELGAIFPSLPIDARPATGAPPVERFRTHHAVGALFEALAAPRPLVLALDDAQWGDPASVELILHLLRRRPAGRILLVLAFRPRAAPARLLAALDRARRDGTADRLELPPLPREDAELLLAGVTDRREREVIYRDSGGNPFYLEQLARARGGDRARPRELDSLAAEGLPPAVIASLAGELDELGTDARRLVGAAAVLGEPFEPDVAAETADMAEDAALAALDELLAVGLVRPTEVPRCFRFRHPIVRRAVYASAGAGWRLAADRRAARALERRGAPLVVRAVHVERSAHAGDEAAITLLTVAAHAAAPRAPAAAARWFAAALRLLPADALPARRLDLVVAHAAALGATGHLEESRVALGEALRLLTGGPRAMRARVVALCAKVDHLLGRHGDARELLLEALAPLDPASVEAARLHVELASDCFFTGDFPGMREWSAKALAAADERANQALTAAVTALGACADYMTCDIASAHAAADRAATLFDELDDQDVGRHLHTLAWFAWCEVFLERFDAAGRHLERGIAIARETGQGHLLALLTQGQANLLLTRGRIAEGAMLADDAIEMGHVSGHGQALTWALTTRCFAHTLAGELADAVRCGEQALEAAGEDVDVVTALAGCYLAQALVESGEPGRARDELLRAAGGEALPMIERAFRPHWHEVLARAELALGHRDAAAVWVERAEQIVEGMELGCRAAEAGRARAALSLAQGDAAAALDAARAAAAQADAVGAPIDAARGRLMAGLALGAAGDRDRAVAELERAEAGLRACGAARWGDHAARELRRLGRRVPRAATRRGDGGLTARELEVAQLVAAGRTNREIAAELFLSAKTVETHLAHIFDKLGVRSRAAVAATIERERGATPV
jgi:DNA-binding NarL/FixJ family response regulator